MEPSIDQFYLFGLTALIACAMKIGILSLVITRSKLTSAFNIVCLALITQNALEFLSAFSYGANPAIAFYFVDGVMFSLYGFAAALVYFCVTVAQRSYAPLLSRLFASGAALVAGLHLSGLLISGYEVLGYTIISIEGVAYPAFQLYILAVILAAFGSLLHGYMTGTPEIKSRCQTTLLAIAPICALGIGVIVLRILGYNASTAIAMPIASTFFAWVLMLDQRGEFVTFKVKWRIIWKLATNIHNLRLADWAEEVEKQLVLEALRTEHNNKSAAARLLGTNQTTFHRKAEKYLARPAKKLRKHPATAPDYS